jgi:hypothetical protein
VTRFRFGPVAWGVLGALLFVVWRLFAPGAELPPTARESSSPSAAVAPEPPERPGEVTALSLLNELVDLAALARFPEPAYQARFASSYDRRSVTPRDANGWFANDDWASSARPNYLRVEKRGDRSEYVLLDAQGPGAVVRIWSASPAGTVRIYFDGEERPEIEEPMDQFLSGAGSIPDPFAYVAARGYNSYFPLPFRRGCKITADSLTGVDPFRGGPLEKLYYQIQYRAYPDSFAEMVRTFRRADLARAANQPRAARVFAEPWNAYVPSTGVSRHAFATSERGLSVSLERPGGAVVRELVVVVADAGDAVLRRARIVASFDGEKTIDAPLGDFFGTAPGLSPYDTLPFTIRGDGTFSCRFVMPFRERATFEILHATGVSAELSVEPEAWSERSLHFHAVHRPPARVATQPPSDLPFLSVRGEGVYVGDAFNIDNPAPRWWGEGDEKIYVDDETFPSFFGTGTEDYYGYAWSTVETFARALHAQPRTGAPDFSGRSSNNRFRTLDAIPFRRSLRFDLELWHWQDTRVTWDAIAYFYARPASAEPK